MARLLIKAIDASHADPAIDRSSCYKRGDVVVVMEDDHEWSGAEGLPNFLQVDCPGITTLDYGYLINPAKATLGEVTSPALRKLTRLVVQVSRDVERPVVARRQYGLDLSAVVFVDGKATISTPTLLNKRMNNVI